jgi:hypothetical protein
MTTDSAKPVLRLAALRLPESAWAALLAEARRSSARPERMSLARSLSAGPAARRLELRRAGQF